MGEAGFATRPRRFIPDDRPFGGRRHRPAMMKWIHRTFRTQPFREHTMDTNNDNAAISESPARLETDDRSDEAFAMPLRCTIAASTWHRPRRAPRHRETWPSAFHLRAAIPSRFSYPPAPYAAALFLSLPALSTPARLPSLLHRARGIARPATSTSPLPSDPLPIGDGDPCRDNHDDHTT